MLSITKATDNMIMLLFVLVFCFIVHYDFNVLFKFCNKGLEKLSKPTLNSQKCHTVSNTDSCHIGIYNIYIHL